MGILKVKVKEIYSIVSQIKNEISPNRFFELGADGDILRSLEAHLEKVASELKELEQIYDLKPFGDAKTYFDTIRIIHKSQDFLKEIRRKDGGNTENTQIFLEYMNELQDILRNFSNIKISEQKKEEYRFGQTTPIPRGVMERDNMPATSSLAPTSNRDQSVMITTKTKSLLLKLLAIIFISFPRVLGRAVLDLFGRDKAVESTAVVLGYFLIIGGGLTVWGILDINTMVKTFMEIWRFFFPVK